MALKRSEQALFAREAIRTFQPDQPPRLVEASVLNPHARRIAEQFNKKRPVARLLSGLFGLGEFAALGAIALGVLASYGRLSDGLLVLPLVCLAIATLALLHGYEPRSSFTAAAAGARGAGASRGHRRHPALRGLGRQPRRVARRLPSDLRRGLSMGALTLARAPRASHPPLEPHGPPGAPRRPRRRRRRGPSSSSGSSTPSPTATSASAASSTTATATVRRRSSRAIRTRHGGRTHRVRASPRSTCWSSPCRCRPKSAS